MLHSQENLRRVLDQIVSKPKLEPAMASIGASPKLIWTWLRRSAAGDKAFIVKGWPAEGDPALPFHEGVQLARKQSVVIYESILRDECMRGIPRIVLEKGEVQYERNPRFLDWTPEDFRALGMDPLERYVLDPITKLPKPLIVYDPAPAHLKIRAAAALMPLWREHKNVELNQKVSGGVMVIGATAPAPRPVIDAIPVDALPPPEPDHDDAEEEWAPLQALQALPVPPAAPPLQAVDRIGHGEVAKGGYKVA